MPCHYVVVRLFGLVFRTLPAGVTKRSYKQCILQGQSSEPLGPLEAACGTGVHKSSLVFGDTMVPIIE